LEHTASPIVEGVEHHAIQWKKGGRLTAGSLVRSIPRSHVPWATTPGIPQLKGGTMTPSLLSPVIFCPFRFAIFVLLAIQLAAEIV